MSTPAAAASAKTAERIRALNDALRATFTGGKVMLTAGVAALSEGDKAAVLEKVRTFAEFNGDNDPHREHDCASFEISGDRFLFKIDYYDSDLQFGSEDPSDAAKTTRVLTIMRADEY